MGIWGAGIFEDDLALDVRATFADALESGKSASQAADAVLAEYDEVLGDPDDGPVVILALASLLTDNGVREHSVLGQAREVISRGEGLARWSEAGGEVLGERQAVYAQMARQLGLPRN